MTERSNKILTAFYRSCLGKNPTFEDDKKAIAAVIEELADILCTDLGELESTIDKLREIANELESSVKSKDT